MQARTFETIHQYLTKSYGKMTFLNHIVKDKDLYIRFFIYFSLSPIVKYSRK